MDFTEWNTIAKGEHRNMKRISELEINKAYVIENIHQVTTKYCSKVTVALEGNIYRYLPARLSDALLKDNEAGLTEIREELAVSTVKLRRLEPRGRYNPVEFLRNLDLDVNFDDLVQ